MSTRSDGVMEWWSDGGNSSQHSNTPVLHHSGRRGRSAFTLIELLVALTILVAVFAIIYATFSSTLNAWQRGNELLEEMHHGDFVMDQMVSALRSTAFFPSAPGKYGFWLKGHDRGYPADELWWVTSGTAFMPPDEPLARGLHRIMVTIENNPKGDAAFAVRAFPYMKDEIAKGDVDPWFVSSRVKGIKCRIWDEEDEDWIEEWENTNSVPSIVEITLFMDPIEKYGQPVEIKRLIEIPIAPAVTGAVVVTRDGETTTTNAPTAGAGGAQPSTSQPRQGGAPGGQQPGGNKGGKPERDAGNPLMRMAK
ncbi:MAG: prepilin-type N-terminal cleavage/methylation domain-containing protein [bacterium]